MFQSDGVSDEQKRAQMEKLVRDELERWDSESSIGGSGRGASPMGSGGPRHRAGSVSIILYSILAERARSCNVLKDVGLGTIDVAI